MSAGLAFVCLATACSSTVAGRATVGSPPATSSSAVPSATDVPSTTSSAAPTTTTAREPDGAVGTVGDDGIGDPYYPQSGNGGYQVDAYDVDARYDPVSNDFSATTTITGTVLSTEGLSRFNLDLSGAMEVSAVTVNGAPAADVEHDEDELVVTPADLAAAGSVLTVTVTYAGNPTVVDGGTGGLGDGGWYHLDGGGALAVGEPFSASAWYPVNEHPSDPATFAVTMTVPEGWQVISNGRQQTDGLPAAPAGSSVFRWAIDKPIASYLTTVYIDKFTVLTDQLADGTPIVSALGPTAVGDRAAAESTREVIAALEEWFGPYPYDSAGGIFPGQDLGFALETASRPVYFAGTSIGIVAHEQAHQWYGDLVTIDRWADICLNECFASYAEWLWDARTNGVDLDARWKVAMADTVRDARFWRSPLVDMGAGEEFTRVYDRGPLAVHALRAEMGDEAFFALLKGWPATHGGQVVDWTEFENYTSSVAGRDMKPFLDAWFRSTTVPDEPYRTPGSLGG